MVNDASQSYQKMRKLIRSQSDQKFLSADGSWTSDVSRAMDISDPASSGSVHALVGTTPFLIYYNFSQTEITEYDFSLPGITAQL